MTKELYPGILIIYWWEKVVGFKALKTFRLPRSFNNIVEPTET